MTKSIQQMALISLFTSILCCGILILPTQAEACCIYNHTKYDLNATFATISETDVEPNSKFCTNGTGGEFHIALFSDTKVLINGHWMRQVSTEFTIKVDDHGWLSVYKESGGKWKVTSHHKDGSVKETRYLHKKN